MRKGGIPRPAATWSWGEASRSRADEGGQVVGVRVERDDSLEDRKRFARRFQRDRMRRDEAREMGSGGVAHHEELVLIAAVSGDLGVDLRDRESDIVHVGRMFAFGEETVVHAGEDPAFAVEEGRLQTHRLLVPLGPSAAVDVNHHGGFGGCVGKIHVELLQRMITVSEVGFDRARLGEEREKGEEIRASAHGG